MLSANQIHEISAANAIKTIFDFERDDHAMPSKIDLVEIYDSVTTQGFTLDHPLTANEQSGSLLCGHLVSLMPDDLNLLLEDAYQTCQNTIVDSFKLAEWSAG